jgi:hypothetical protein
MLHSREEALLDVAPLPRIEPPLSILHLQVLDLRRTAAGSTPRRSVSASLDRDRGCCLWSGGGVDPQYIGIRTARAAIFDDIRRQGKVDALEKVVLR